LEIPEQQKTPRTSTVLLVTVVVVCLVAGGLIGSLTSYLTASEKIDNLQNQVNTLQHQFSQVQSTQNIDYSDITVFSEDNVSVSQLYAQVEESVVVIRGMVLSSYDLLGRTYYSQIQGSGFVYDYMGQNVVVTNYHVVDDAVNITVTFANGNAYPATVLGSDPYAELGVLSVDSPEEEFVPLEVASSSSLQVGNPVIVVGTP
jgi:S1-C subfamily serine protease